MPRCSIETLLHAFVPAPHVHHTHPDGINVLAGTADGERARARVLRRRGRVDPLHPPGLHALASRSARRSAPTPTLKLVVLAKHGLIMWGDSAEEAYRTTIEVDQPGRRLRQRAHERQRRASAARATRALLDDQRREALLRELLPAIRGAVSSERSKVLTVDTSPRVARVRLDSERRPTS